NYSDWDDDELGGYEIPGSHRLLLAFYSLIFLLGVLGNGAVIWVTALELRRSVNGVWFLNLAVADLLCCLVLPFLALPLAQDHHWPLGHGACKALPSLTLLAMFCSVLLLTAISADRCALATLPVWCHNHRTPALARLASGACWLLATLLSLPSIIFRSVRSDPFSSKITCVLDYEAVGGYQRVAEQAVAISRFLCGFLGPLVAIVTSYGLLLATVRGRGLGRSQRATKLVLLVVGTFFCCWLPYHIVGLILATTSPGSRLFKGASAADPVVAAIAYGNSCINPLLYGAAGHHLRKQLRGSWRAAIRGVLADDPPSSA
ncbi:C5AR1 protein, partial [Rhinopomastus cyanomelas]|nr:C5AR1 protein [Rhinopomastus cyanomelas]